MEQYKTCTQCAVQFPITNFYKHATTKDRLMPVCKSCHRMRCRIHEQNNRAKRSEYYKKWYNKNKDRQRQKRREYVAANKEKVAETFREWRKQNPEMDVIRHGRRRAAKDAVQSFKVTQRELKKIRSQPCFYCGSTQKICVDHVVPLSRGGNNSIGNYLPACISCNSSKKNKFITEWKKVRGW